MLSVDDLIEAHAKGDQQVGSTYNVDQPGSASPDERQYPPGIGLVNVTGHHILLPCPLPGNAATIAAGATAVIRTEDQPDFWVVTVPNVANVALEVHIGNGRGPAPLAKLGPGGYCRVPGRGLYLTLVNYGSAASAPTIVAASGWGEMETGDVLIVPGVGTMPS